MKPGDQELSSLIRRYATRHAAPDGLRARVISQVALLEARRGVPAARARPARPGWFDVVLNWRPALLSFSLGLACAALVLPLAQRLDFSAPVDAELVAGHVRALREGPLIQVASSDRHTVKPWFQERLDYAPPVFDFAADGFALIGGRVERVRSNEVAALTYAREHHMVDVFVWPADGTAAPVQHTTRRGFNLVRWVDGSMQLWVVSDLERPELEQFVQLWQARAAKQ
jgi:anti-sigma factor RsiW